MDTRDWTAYNGAQTAEKALFTSLLHRLCQGVQAPLQSLGRPRLPLSDMAFACVLKVYTGASSRRFMGHMKEAEAKGLIGRTPHFNSVSNYLASPDLTPVLKGLITASALPLKAVETDFAVDGTGFSTCRFVRWYDHKYGVEVTEGREWLKVHVMVGTRTKIVTSVEVSDAYAHDSPFFVPLVEETAQRFHVLQVSADKAYLSRGNMDAVAQVGAVPYIPFKSSTAVPADDDSTWTRMYHLFALNREAFMAHYHKRSNAESAFAMIKGKFGDSVRSKSHTGQVNEALCKVLCHNICILVHSIYALGLEPAFCAGVQSAQKVIA